MGEVFDAMMKFLVAALALSVATALESPCVDCPSVDDIAPETEMVTTETSAALLGKLKATVESKGDNACLDMAHESKESVNRAADELQSELDHWPGAEHCPDEGQSAVTQAINEEADARMDKERKDSELAEARSTKVDYPPIEFRDLNEPQCGNFWEDPAYTSVAAAVNAAQEAADKAADRLTDAEGALREAHAEQERLREECYCRAKDEHAELFTELQNRLSADQKDTWEQAFKLECVVRGVNMNSCAIDSLPSLRQHSLGEEADAARCRSRYLGRGNSGWASPYTQARGDQICQATYGQHAAWCSKKDIVDIPNEMSNGYNNVRDPFSVTQDFKNNNLALCAHKNNNGWSSTWDWRCNGQTPTCCEA